MVQDLLADKHTYRDITGDPTTKYKNKLIQIFRTIKAQGGLGDVTYKRLYPTSAVPPNFMDSPKSRRMSCLRPIVCSRGVVTYMSGKVYG